MVSNRFSAHLKTFNNFSGWDLLHLSKRELIEICGLLDGIRLFNSLHNQPIKPKRVLYVCSEFNEEFHPIHLYDVTLRELLRELTKLAGCTLWRNFSANQRDQLDQHANNGRDQLGAEEEEEEEEEEGTMEEEEEIVGNGDRDEEDHLSLMHQRKKSLIDRSASAHSRSSTLSAGGEPLESDHHSAHQTHNHHHKALPNGRPRVYHEHHHDTNNNSQNSLPLPPICRLLVEGLTSVRVLATDKVVQMLENNSAWRLRFNARGPHSSAAIQGEARLVAAGRGSGRARGGGHLSSALASSSSPPSALQHQQQQHQQHSKRNSDANHLSLGDQKSS